MDTVTQSIPFTAWEQAVFVALFIMFVIGLLAWFTKQSDKWQSFIANMEERWREFNREQRKDNNACMQSLESSTRGLTDVVQQLLMQVKEMRDDDSLFRQTFHEHDLQAKEILNQVTNGKPVTTARAKKTTTTTKENKE